MSIFCGRQWQPSGDADQADELLLAFLRERSPLRLARSADGFSLQLWQHWLRLQPYELVAGADLVERAAAASLAVGECLAPIPVAETLVTHWLLGALGGEFAVELRERVVDGGELVALCPTPQGAGTLRAVPFGAVAASVLYLDGDAVRQAAGARAAVPENIGALPVAPRSVSAQDVVLCRGPAAVVAWRQAVAAWRILLAAQLVGAGRRSLAMAISYVGERHQFGSPVGAFQAVAHRLADLATALTGAELLVQATAVEAGILADADPDVIAARADRAVYAASKAAEPAATEALHFHGGYGFALEQDIQLYVRHIKAWTLLLGGQHAALARLAAAR